MDEAMFRKVADRLRERLLNTATDYLRQREEAEDVVQDALIRVWQLRVRTDSDMERLSFVIVRNLCIDRLRRRKQTVDIADGALPPQAIQSLSSPDFTNSAEENNTSRYRRVISLIDTLPPVQQTAMRLRHIQGMDYADIAALLHTSPQNVRQAVSRARRSILKRYYNDRH